jgi:hypothetical protein
MDWVVDGSFVKTSLFHNRWIWCKYCVQMYVNGKMIPVETIPGVGDKGEWWRVWLQLIYLLYCKNLCKWHNVLLPITTIKKKWNELIRRFKKKSQKVSEDCMDWDKSFFTLSVWTQGLEHFMQMLYHLNHTPSSFSLACFYIWSVMFCFIGLRPQSS